MDLQIFQVFLLLFTGCSGVLINSTDQTIIEKPVGGSVMLDCQFNIAPEDTGPLEIEWTRLSHGGTSDSEIIVYSAGQVYDDYSPPLKNRVYFSSENPRIGDGSINLQRLTLSDSGTYKCQVKKVPGIHSIKTTLRVLHPPSKPLCYTQGTTEVSKTVVLHCEVEKGASPIFYIWQKTTGSKTLPSSAGSAGIAAGKVNILQASESDSGTYHCTARNRVGVEECFLEVQITHPFMVEKISAAVVSVLLVLGVIAFIIYCQCKSKKEVVEEDTANDILEDASPPKHRRQLRHR
ncbi:hypothetical protein ACEWY4_018222 [Coilia grayii]|uniref:Ig-like domain-containing protein n=1 Tax=Coilia grayii TaxID=363190 RepID=A0ABD1JJ41_9TELE